MIDHMIHIGDKASVTLDVTTEDTAIALRSGDMAVLGTPRIVALCEQAAVAAIGSSIDSDLTSVGTSIAIEHLVATAIGGRVTAVATVSAEHGNVIEFDLLVTEGETTVARGTHERFVVDRARFEQKNTAN